MKNPKKETLILRVINFLFQANSVESKRVLRSLGEQTVITNGPWMEGFYLTLDFRLLTLFAHNEKKKNNLQKKKTQNNKGKLHKCMCLCRTMNRET